MGGGWAGDTGNSGQSKVNLKHRRIQIWDCQHRELSKRQKWKSRLDCGKKKKKKVKLCTPCLFMDLLNILEALDFTCSACRSPACDPANGPSWPLHRQATHKRARALDPPACFAFHRGQSLSCQSESSPLHTLEHSASLRHPPLSGRRIDERRKRQQQGLFYGLRGKHPTVLNLHSGKSNFD